MASDYPQYHWIMPLMSVVACAFTAASPFSILLWPATGRISTSQGGSGCWHALESAGLGCMRGRASRFSCRATFPRWVGVGALQPLLAEVWNLAPLLLLLAIYHRLGDGVEGEAPISPELRGATNAALTVAFGLLSVRSG